MATKINVNAIPDHSIAAVKLDDISSVAENPSNKTTSITTSSTDIQYPSAKAVKGYVDGVVGEINAMLDDINGEVI